MIAMAGLLTGRRYVTRACRARRTERYLWPGCGVASAWNQPGRHSARSRCRVGRQENPIRESVRIPFSRVLTAILIVGLVGASFSLSGREETSRVLAAPGIAPDDGVLFGSYVKPFSGWTMEAWKAAVNRRETQLNRTFDINHHYYGWSAEFPGWKLWWDVDNRRYSMISWDAPNSYSTINSGSADRWIRSQAAAIKRVRRPVFIRWMWEMDIRTGDAGTPAQFVSAWRRLHRIFAQEGARNAMWVWCPTANAFSSSRANDYYPGDAYVDWICADGYNFAPNTPGAPWRSFRSIFTNFYRWAAPHGKPLMVGETGTGERNPGEKADWIRGILPALKNDFPRIKALVYFDSATKDYSGTWYNWRPDSSPAAFEAYKDLAADPYLNRPHSFTLRVNVQGSGAGSVTSTPTGITRCRSDCTAAFRQGSSVTLSADPDIGSRFVSWSGACRSAASVCTVDMTWSRTATATFGSASIPPGTVTMTKPARWFQRRQSIDVAWKSDEPPGTTYEFRYRSAPPAADFSTASTPQSIDGTQARFKGERGYTYCFSARSTSDSSSPWSEERCTAVPLDDRALAASRGWERKNGTPTYRRTLSISQRRRSHLTSRRVEAKRIAVLASSCRRCGRVQVMWNGNRVATIDLRSARTRHRRVFKLPAFESLRSGRVRIKTVSRGKRVLFDGLVISRR